MRDDFKSSIPDELIIRIEGMEKKIRDRESTWKKAEEDYRKQIALLQDSEAWMRSILESCDESIVVHDPDGCYLYSNSSRHYGSSREMSVGRNVADFHSPENAASIMKEIRKVISSGKPSCGLWEYAMEGKEMCFIVYRYPLMNIKQEIFAVASIAINVSELCRSEAGTSDMIKRRINFPSDWSRRVEQIQLCLNQPEKLENMNIDEKAHLHEFLIHLLELIKSRGQRPRKGLSSKIQD